MMAPRDAGRREALLPVRGARGVLRARLYGYFAARRGVAFCASWVLRRGATQGRKNVHPVQLSSAESFAGSNCTTMGRILRQIACAAGVMSLVPTSRHLPQQRRAPSRSALQMASQLETLEPQLKRVVITGMGRVQCMNHIVAARPPPLNPGLHAIDATPAR